MAVKEIERYQVSLKALVRRPDGKVLILKAPDTWTIAGFYDVPGGRIDTDEMDLSYEQIIRRELKEEIGTDDVVIHPHPVGMGRRVFLPGQGNLQERIAVLYIFFEAETNFSEVTPLEEYTEAKWIDIDQVDLATTFPPGFRDGIAMYRTWLKEQRTQIGKIRP